MKKLFAGIIIGAMLTSFGFAEDLISFVAVKANFPIMVDGKPFTSDNPAVVIDGRTYLPLRAMGNVLNVPVNWNSEKGQVEVGSVQKKDDFEFTNVVIKESYGYTKVQGEIKNNTSITKSLSFKVAFYDSTGKLMGTAQGFVNSLKAGEMKTFEALASEWYEGYASYKIQVDSVY